LKVGDSDELAPSVQIMACYGYIDKQPFVRREWNYMGSRAGEREGRGRGFCGKELNIASGLCIETVMILPNSVTNGRKVK
jgi:hypothetical protein